MDKLNRRTVVTGAAALVALPAIASAANAAPKPVHHRSQFAPLPRSREEWEWVYYHAMTDDRLAPRVCPGELLIFDPLAVPEVGSIVLVTFEPGGRPDRLLGILTDCTDHALSLALGLYDEPVKFTRANCRHTIHAAVGVMMPMETENERNNAVINAALRRKVEGAAR